MLVQLQGKALSGWFYMHMLAQLLGLLAAIAGVVLAILAFGWKELPDVRLYLPHKWIGVGVMAMAVLQVYMGVTQCMQHCYLCSSRF